MATLSVAAVRPLATSRDFVPHKLLNSSTARAVNGFQHLNLTSSSTQMDQVKQESSNAPQLQLTYLEGNSWLWSVAGVSVLVDPVLVGNLDFGIPWLYDGAKRILKAFTLEDLKQTDCLLITQSLDDHCHKRTLEPLSKMYPDLPVVATKNAQPMLSKLFKQVTYLEPGESTTLSIENKLPLKVTASTGPVLGAPWQRPENGYFVEVNDPKVCIYFEPHCVFDRKTLQGKRADVVITPVIKQKLPFLTLVSGQEDAVELSKILQPRYVVPMKNGDLEARGILSKMLLEVGTTESFKSLLQEVLPETEVLEPEPGVPLEIRI